MNNVITLAALLSTLTLVSCNSKSSSKSRTCTFNDRPVDCSTMNPQVSGKGLTITATVKARIALTNDTLEILENTQSLESETKNGKNYECQAFTNAGDQFKTKVKNKSLQIIAGKDVVNYKLLSETSNGVVGKWENVEKDANGSTTSTLIISEESMEVIVDCQFNQ